MPHLVHVAVSVVGLLVFEVMASAMVVSARVPRMHVGCCI